MRTKAKAPVKRTPATPTIPTKKTKQRRLINVQDFANKLGCSTYTVKRMVKSRLGFPQPSLVLNKLVWDEDEADAYANLVFEEGRVEHEQQAQARREQAEAR